MIVAERKQKGRRHYRSNDRRNSRNKEADQTGPPGQGKGIPVRHADSDCPASRPRRNDPPHLHHSGCAYRPGMDSRRQLCDG